jgi:glucose/arabinose dehydrogenase
MRRMMKSPLLSRKITRLTLCGALIIAAQFVSRAPATYAAPTAAMPPDDPRIHYGLAPIASGFTNPLFLTHAGDSRLFIVEQGGLIWVYKNGSTLATPFLDISSNIGQNGGEQGLLGLAFEPDYAATGRFYVYYTNGAGNLTITRFNVSANPDVANLASAQVILTIPHPTYSNHNGGWIAFGPDDNLYAGTGDGGNFGGEPFHASQNLTDLRGKILRLNVAGQVTYTIPAGNVFTTTQRPEVFAIGLRNPWRNSFDRLTGDLYIGDVGQEFWEEIDVLPAGRGAGVNFGWNQYEGTHTYCNNCPDSGIPPTMPVVEYPQSVAGLDNCAVIGGYVYRGARYPWLDGDYFYADECGDRVWAMWQTSPGVYTSTLVLASADTHSFGEDKDGEIYLVDGGAGAVYRLTSMLARVYVPIASKS